MTTIVGARPRLWPYRIAVGAFATEFGEMGILEETLAGIAKPTGCRVQQEQSRRQSALAAAPGSGPSVLS